jgi:hypothetical protein
MSIQTEFGPPDIRPDDVQIVHQGIGYALKLYNTDGYPRVMLCTHPKDGVWALGAEILATDDGAAFSVTGFVADLARFLALVVERVSAWLAANVLPGGQMSDVEKLDAALRTLHFAVRDGNLVIEQR